MCQNGELLQHRCIATFHANTPQHNKEMVLKSMTRPNGLVWIVFATVASGMGVNLLDTNTIIHYGASQSTDDYFQKSGRGGHSGNEAQSIVYWKPIDCLLHKELASTRDHEVASVRRYLRTQLSVAEMVILILYVLNLVAIPVNVVISVLISVNDLCKFHLYA